MKRETRIQEVVGHPIRGAEGGPDPVDDGDAVSDLVRRLGPTR